jgi:NAD(P)-dependent dehydrogenase (short-subunit alcohol dehydrogenase family)
LTNGVLSYQVFANAGIVERANFYARQEETMDGLPQPPNMLASRVMFDGAVWTVYLGLHFLRKNGTPGGSIIILASSAGIYPAPNGPLYSASKHGMVGLTRSLASRLWNENIHISCVCPGAVATGLMPPEAFKQMDQETFTPLSKIASVVESLLEREELTVGAAVEVVGPKHFLRWRPEFCDQTMEKCWNSFGGTSDCSDGGLTRNWKQ